MSDSDDDWFSKDVDEMVEEVKRKSKSQSADVSRVGNFSANDNHQTSNRTPLFCDPDYGGNYAANVAETRTKSKSGGKIKSGKGEVYVHKISWKKLKYISELKPLDAFLEVYQVDCGFFECFNEQISMNDVRLVIIILSKLCQLPLDEFGRDFLTKLIESTTLVKNIEKLLANEPYPSDVVDKVVAIGWKVESLGLQCPNFIVIIDSLYAKNYQQYSIQKEIKDLSVALRNERKLFTEIYPTLEEITQNEVIVVKPNIIKGKYASIEEYIHTHLSLLREDFVAPLREFISELKAFESIEKVPFKRVYKATRFLPNDFLKSHKSKGLAILIDLMPNERSDTAVAGESNKTPWINPKKLIYGTLLCFTTSLQFTDLILAVVSHRDFDNLAKGYIYVEIVRMYNITNLFERDFIMFENEVYFEPYHHVYRVLRSLRENNFPLGKYLVQVEQNSEPPNYLKGSAKYVYKHQNFRFNPLDVKTYPPREQLQLDESQYAAFQHSLGRKFSLIQGPPGTGKTFIGLKIVSALLENVDSRVLVVCYTNHALDQFLSGILNTTTEIVRLGSQSKHEQLDEYNIKQIADGGPANRNLRTCFYNAKVEYTKLMEEFDRLQTNNNKEENYKQIIESQEKLRKSSAKLAELKQMFEYHLVKSKKVIGMTTTYAARSSLLLQLLEVPIVIVEEAAEVLEAHIVAAITQFTEHVILIGDHQQLRPSTSVYRLSQKFNMDISLFERMINNNLNCICLNTQHRMRPEIANLIRPTIYKDLKDSDNVKNYSGIRGMANNLYFINHDKKEIKSADETTKRNPHEVKFLLCLASYLLAQNYKPEDIVILCTYNGQMFDFFNERRNHSHLEKVRITVVDNFQGEESKIILLSLVRNNNENKIGYLAMRNRICVALSRAQEGFYAIGAINFLARNNSTWHEIKTTLEKQNAISDLLPLMCTHHGTINHVRSAENFEFMERGMCCCK